MAGQVTEGEERARTTACPCGQPPCWPHPRGRDPKTPILQVGKLGPEWAQPAMCTSRRHHPVAGAQLRGCRPGPEPSTPLRLQPQAALLTRASEKTLCVFDSPLINAPPSVTSLSLPTLSRGLPRTAPESSTTRRCLLPPGLCCLPAQNRSGERKSAGAPGRRVARGVPAPGLTQNRPRDPRPGGRSPVPQLRCPCRERWGFPPFCLDLLPENLLRS